jgi:hypothetical protein
MAMSNHEARACHTQHAFLVVWGRFAQKIGLIERIEAAKLKQKKYWHSPQTKVLEFLVATLAGLKHLQDISLFAHPLDRDPAVAEAWEQAGWPRIVVAGDGSLHVVWFYGGVYDNGELHYRSWEESAWSEVISISGQVEAGNPYGFYDDPIQDIAVNRAGQVFVAWMTGSPDTALAIRNGESWSPPQIMAENFYGSQLSLATDETGAPQVIQRASGGYIYHITGGASSDITKHYYAGDERLATRAGGVLYYTLPDPTGTSLVMTKANGDEVGQVLYDGYGAVLASTLPATLTTTLAGSGNVPDPDTGLVYLGDGR